MHTCPPPPRTRTYRHTPPRRAGYQWDYVFDWTILKRAVTANSGAPSARVTREEAGTGPLVRGRTADWGAGGRATDPGLGVGGMGTRACVVACVGGGAVAGNLAASKVSWRADLRPPQQQGDARSRSHTPSPSACPSRMMWRSSSRQPAAPAPAATARAGGCWAAAAAAPWVPAQRQRTAAPPATEPPARPWAAAEPHV